MQIRNATEQDLDWLMFVAKHAYENGTYDEEAGKNYWKQIMSNPSCKLLRGDKAAMGAIIVSMPYAPSKKFAALLPVMSLGNSASELMKMTRMLIEWAKNEGASRFDFSAITGVDLGPLAKRFGGVPISPAYTVRLSHV